jgi:tRNA (pseudouridine54-N1)-methyltransferase
MERRFAIIGHRAQSSGKVRLNDLAGGAGRMDVLVRAVNAALFLSHGMRQQSHITLHLMGGPGPPRRIWFDGTRLQGLHSDERAIAGQVNKVLQYPVPAIGQLVEIWPGLWHSGGDVSTTIAEWEREEVTMVKLDADSPSLECYDGNEGGGEHPEKIGFFLSDDQPFSDEENILLGESMELRSLGSQWIQGHIAIGVIHHLLDEGRPLSL